MTTLRRAALLICSDRAARNERADRSADGIKKLLAEHGYALEQRVIVADDRAQIAARLGELAAAVPLVLTSGGTGVGPRDVTVEATRDVIERELPGLGEAMRAASLSSTPLAMLSRATAGVRGRSLIVNLPGSPRGSVECLAVVLRPIGHALDLIAGAVTDCAAQREK